MTPDQVRTARVLLGWSQRQLGLRSNTSLHMVRTFEQSGRVVPLNSRDRTVPIDAVAAVRVTLEAAGVEFTDEGAPGVRLRKPSQ